MSIYFKNSQATMIVSDITTKEILFPLFGFVIKANYGRISSCFPIFPKVWIFLLALRRGSKVGLFGATIYGVVQFTVDPYMFSIAQALLDYPVAFGLLGVASFFQKRPFLGVSLGVIGRFIAHFFSGIIFFTSFVPKGMNPAVYSTLYNGGYLLVELVISIYVIYVLRANKVLEIYL